MKLSKQEQVRLATALIEVAKDLKEFAERIMIDGNEANWTGSWLALEVQGHICNELGITEALPGGELGDSVPR